eukprot:766299-Hanusia_phi.AAC.1
MSDPNNQHTLLGSESSLKVSMWNLSTGRMRMARRWRRTRRARGGGGGGKRARDQELPARKMRRSGRRRGTSRQQDLDVLGGGGDLEEVGEVSDSIIHRRCLTRTFPARSESSVKRARVAGRGAEVLL